MKHFDVSSIEKLDHIYKINLINSCSGFKSANLIGTQSKSGKTNVAVFSSVIHLGSAPALFGFILRPATVPRNTYENIKETGVFTINHIYKDIITDAHHTSAKYPDTISEFDATALIPEYKNDFKAPFVLNSPVQMSLELVEEYTIKSNNTILVIGKLVDLYVQDDCIESDGLINLSKAKVAAINGLDMYSIPTENIKLGYQQPKKELLSEKR